MAQNETPTAITREEFEAGVMFSTAHSFDCFRLTPINPQINLLNWSGVILNQNGYNVGSVISIEENRFTLRATVLGEQHEFLVPFSNLKKDNYHANNKAI